MIHFDSHLDTWEEYFNETITHGTPFKRAFDENLINTESAVIKEILHVTLVVLNQYNNSNFNLFFEKVMDDRQMPTIFLNSQIENAINKKIGTALIDRLTLNEDRIKLISNSLIK